MVQKPSMAFESAWDETWKNSNIDGPFGVQPLSYCVWEIWCLHVALLRMASPLLVVRSYDPLRAIFPCCFGRRYKAWPRVEAWRVNVTILPWGNFSGSKGVNLPRSSNFGWFMPLIYGNIWQCWGWFILWFATWYFRMMCSKDVRFIGSCLFHLSFFRWSDRTWKRTSTMTGIQIKQQPGACLTSFIFSIGFEWTNPSF
jgi:hypothetical protein